MEQQSGIRRASRGTVRRDPRLFRSLLVPLDLSPTSDRVIGRVTLLPLAEHAKITLLHVVPSGLLVQTRNRTGIAHTFLGTVAGDVLRDVACDVLVVPPTDRRGCR